jgi:hypothetical protein
LAITATTWHAYEWDDPWSFPREWNAGERAEFLKDTLACMANAGADTILWFNAVEYDYTCCEDTDADPITHKPCVSPVEDDIADPDSAGWSLGLLDENLCPTSLYFAFAEVAMHLGVVSNMPDVPTECQ